MLPGGDAACLWNVPSAKRKKKKNTWWKTSVHHVFVSSFERFLKMSVYPLPAFTATLTHFYGWWKLSFSPLSLSIIGGLEYRPGFVSTGPLLLSKNAPLISLNPSNWQTFRCKQACFTPGFIKFTASNKSILFDWISIGHYGAAVVHSTIPDGAWIWGLHVLLQGIFT